jgi:excisionase family DNA binding protein
LPTETEASPFALATSDVVRGKTYPELRQKKEKKPRPAPPPPESVLAYQVLDAAKVSGISRATLYRLMREGKLRTIFVCGRRLIPPDALREVLAGKA